MLITAIRKRDKGIIRDTASKTGLFSRHVSHRYGGKIAFLLAKDYGKSRPYLNIPKVGGCRGRSQLSGGEIRIPIAVAVQSGQPCIC